MTGQRYINQLNNGGNVLFFVREYKKEGTFASPFTCLGLADFQSHYGSAPISIVWKMRGAYDGVCDEEDGEGLDYDDALTYLRSTEPYLRSTKF